MRIEIYLSNGKVEKIEAGASEIEESTVREIAEKLTYQVETLGFVCYDYGGTFRMINANVIDEIRIVPGEEKMIAYIYLDTGITVEARQESGTQMDAAELANEILRDINTRGVVCLPNGDDYVLVNAEKISFIRVSDE